MQDLMAKLQEIFSTQEGQNQLNNIASMLNQNGGQPAQAAEPTPPTQASPTTQGFDFASLAGMLQGLGQNTQNQAPPEQNDNPLGNIDMGMIMNLQKMLSSVNVNDKNAQLLRALKPHFGEQRQAKVDQAMTIMRLISMLPMLKESGILKGIL